MRRAQGSMVPRVDWADWQGWGERSVFGIWCLCSSGKQLYKDRVRPLRTQTSRVANARRGGRRIISKSATTENKQGRLATPLSVDYKNTRLRPARIDRRRSAAEGVVNQVDHVEHVRDTIVVHISPRR